MPSETRGCTDRGSLDASARPQLVVLEEMSEAECERVLNPHLEAACPELLLVNFSYALESRLREEGFPIAFNIREPWCTDRIGEAVVLAITVRLPLRLLSQRAVGRLALKDAIALVRFYMLREALWQTRSKRATARLLGVTRPAVQSMVRTLSLPDPGMPEAVLTNHIANPASRRPYR